MTSNSFRQINRGGGAKPPTGPTLPPDLGDDRLARAGRASVAAVAFCGVMSSRGTLKVHECLLFFRAAVWHCLCSELSVINRLAQKNMQSILTFSAPDMLSIPIKQLDKGPCLDQPGPRAIGKQVQCSRAVCCMQADPAQTKDFMGYTTHSALIRERQL